MKISLASDLHLECNYLHLDNQNNSDVLVLAGDVLVADDLYQHPNVSPEASQAEFLGPSQYRAYLYRKFLAHVSSEFGHVVIVAGNHEFYNGRWHQTLDILRNEYSKYSNIHFLENSSVVINDVTFVGATLWTDLNRGCALTPFAVQETMNDYRRIRDDKNNYSRIKPYQTVFRHADSVKAIANLVETAVTDRVVVVSHHSPSWGSQDPKFANDRLINGAYYSDLSDLILDHDKIKYWFHGHVHYASRHEVGTTVVACNPRGYHSDQYHEDTGWDFSRIFEI